MSNEQAIARRYAKGLKLSLSDQEFEQVEQELKLLSKAFDDDESGLMRIFSDPAFSPRERAAVLNNLAKKLAINTELHKFLQLLTDKDRISLLPSIYKAFVVMVDEHKGRLRAIIKSATKVDDQQIKEISTAIASVSNKKVLIESVIDEELLGGMRIEVAGTVFDGSIKAKLGAMRSELLHEIGQ